MKALSYLLTIGLLASSSAFACRVPMPNESRIREADTVLLGTVMATEDPAPAQEVRIQLVKVKVTKVLKGKSAPHVDAIALCAPTVRVGERIVVLVSDGQKKAYQGEFYEELIKKTYLKPEIPATKSSCERHGGKWGRYGLLGTEECDMPTSDAGSGCSSNSQCQSVCIANENVAGGTATAGRCFHRTMTRGACLNFVMGGVAQGTLCSD